MDSYRSNGNKRIYEQPKPKQQREKRKSKFNHYDNLNLNNPVNFISSGNNNEQSKSGDDNNNESNDNCKSQLRNPSPPPPPIISNRNFNFHQTPQLKGIGGKLLLQMGYEPGKGLGKNLQGIQVPIKAKPRYGRGAIGAYGPENISTLPIESINITGTNSRRYNNKFVADEINDLYNDDDHANINNESDVNTNNKSNVNTNNEQNDDTLIEDLTNIVMALDDTNKITSTTSSNYNTIIEENSNEKNDLDININSTWKLSIICFDYPKLKLTGDQFEQIEYKIFNILHDDNNSNEPIQFHKSELINGTIQILCANESTKNWLYRIIENNNLLYNIKLKIVETESLTKYTQIKLWLCGPKFTADIILKTLQKQNHNLRTEKWRIYGLNYFRNFNSTELIVGIDCISLAELKKINLKPFYRFGRCGKKFSPHTNEDNLSDNLMFLMQQISSMQTLNEHFNNSIDIENNIESDIEKLSWTDFMIKTRSSLLENFGYDPKNDTKLLIKCNVNNTMLSIYNNKNDINTTKIINKDKQTKISIIKVSGSLKVAVVDRSDIEGKIRNINHQDILREELENALILSIKESPSNIIPACHWSGFKDDYFKIICEDEQSKICINEFVKNIGNVWYGADLDLVGLDDLLQLSNALNRKYNTYNPIIVKKMYNKLSREFDQHWRESERNARRAVEDINLKSRKNIQKNNKKINSKFEKDYLSYTDSVPNYLKIAIIDRSDGQGKIYNIKHQNLLHDALYSAMRKICDDPNIVPRYYWSGFKDNIFQIICYDEKSKICMEEMVKNIGELWEGADLNVVGLGEVLNYQQISSRNNPFKSKRFEVSNESDDNWESYEELQRKELIKISNKFANREPKEQRKSNSSKCETYATGFLINIRKISNDKFKNFEFCTIKEALELFIHEAIKTEEFFPQFENITSNDEILHINCANLATQEWVSKYIIPKFSLYPPLQNSDLIYEIKNHENKLENLISAKIWLPGLKLESKDYLEMLQAQNNPLDTKLWKIENRKDASDGTHLYVTIDKMSAVILSGLDKRPYFGSGRAEVKL